MTHSILSKTIHAAFVGIAVLAVAGCSHDKAASELITMNLEPYVDAPLTGSDRIEAKILLHPAFSDSTMLKSPALVSVRGSELYILSNKAELMAFDSADGRCIGSFSHQGGGPEEYPQLNQASVGPDGNWQILSTDRIYTYTPQGQFIARHDADSIFSITPLGTKWAAFKNTDKSEYQPLAFFTSDWKQINAVVSPAVVTNYAIPGGTLTFKSFLQSNGDFISNDTLYDINANTAEISPVVAFNAGKYTMPDLRTVDDSKDVWEIKRTHLGLISAFPIAGNHVLLYYILENSMKMQIYDLSDGSLTYSNAYDFKLKGYPVEINGKTYACSAAYYAAGDRFYMIATDDSMAEATGDENANPAIVEIYLK